ncbi:hypothetical protein [Absidia glauca]|uniref:Uncharacterized protein n=1 Tax=Absidia glauca TaxID=4829 RepID=A0A168PVA7_ABSGL|nr:hypothetical protein [Absidia glauca]
MASSNKPTVPPRSGLIPGIPYAGAVHTKLQTKKQSVIHSTHPTSPSPSPQTPQTAQVVRSIILRHGQLQSTENIPYGALLDPCFKTGHIKSLCLRPKREKEETGESAVKKSVPPEAEIHFSPRQSARDPCLTARCSPQSNPSCSLDNVHDAVMKNLDGKGSTEHNRQEGISSAAPAFDNKNPLSSAPTFDHEESSTMQAPTNCDQGDDWWAKHWDSVELPTFDSITSKVWAAERTARSAQDVTPNEEFFFRLLGCCLTDFWSMCFALDFCKDKDRSFWVERVVPLFKYVGNNSRVVFAWCEDRALAQQQCQRTPGIWTNETSALYADGVGRINGKEIILMESSSGYSNEGYQHSMDDTEKLIDEMASTLKMELLRKKKMPRPPRRMMSQPTGFLVEMRSAIIPVNWEQRSDLIKVFELLSCLFVSEKQNYKNNSTTRSDDSKTSLN